MKKLTLIILVAIVSCSDDDSGTEFPLTGKWIEVSTLSDTLTFLDNELMLLDRGREIRNGHSLPKLGSGHYEYQISSNQITLRWMLSSSMIYRDYHFGKAENTIQIENFYDPDEAGAIQTFRKIE